MSQPDIETLRAEYEAISRRDWDAVFRGAHPDFELTTPDRSEPQEFFECGDRIVVFFLLRSRPKGSSAVVEIQAGHLWTMRDGKAARCEIFPEREKALEAAGL